MMDAAYAEVVLDTMRRSLGLSVGVVRYQPVGDDEVWRIDATDASGERWTASHPDYGAAVVMLAELVGFDLEG